MAYIGLPRFGFHFRCVVNLDTHMRTQVLANWESLSDLGTQLPTACGKSRSLLALV